MKRFVTYLYECQKGNKSKNVGFIRVNVRGQETAMEVYLRNVARTVDKGTLFVLIYEEKLQGIELGEIQIQNGQSDTRIEALTDNIKDSGISIEDIEGIGIRLDSGLYIASCWKDTYAEGIIRGEFVVEKEDAEEIEQCEKEEVIVAAQAVSHREEMVHDGPCTSYEKIDLSQIRDLPSPNWHFATNSFLVHGFWNYGYLVLKKEMEEDKEILSLGIPGVFERPEAVMAVFFGFPKFEAIPSEMVGVGMNKSVAFPQKEKNQEAKEGTFGCWFVNLKL